MGCGEGEIDKKWEIFISWKPYFFLVRVDFSQKILSFCTKKSIPQFSKIYTYLFTNKSSKCKICVFKLIYGYLPLAITLTIFGSSSVIFSTIIFSSIYSKKYCKSYEVTAKASKGIKLKVIVTLFFYPIVP